MGRRLLPRLGLADTAGRAGACAGLGLGVLAAGVLAVAAAGVLNFAALAGLLLLAGFFAFRSGEPWLKEWRRTLPPLPSGPAAWALFAGFPVLLMGAFIPDPFYDSLSYHLALPQTYLAAGKLVPVPDNVHSAFPQTAEMLYALGMGLGKSDALPLLLQLAGGAAVIAALLHRGGSAGRRTGALAAAIWFSAPIVMENLRFAKSDLFLALWVTLAYLALEDWEPGSPLRRAAPAAIFAGLAVATKYTGAVFAAGLWAALFVRSRALPARERVRTLALFAGLALLPVLPWLVRNILVFGNPLYPFFQELSGFRYMRPENWAVFRAEQSQFSAGAFRWSDLALTFWRQTFSGHEYPSMNFIGPVWLAALPAALLFGLEEKKMRAALLWCCAFALFGASRTSLARYFFLPVLPVLSLALAGSAAAAPEGFFRRTYGLLLAAGILLCGAGWLPALERAAYGRTALAGLSEEKTRLLYSPGTYDAAVWMDANLPRDCRLLLVGETRGRLYPRPLTAPSVHNEHLLSRLVNEGEDPDGLYRRLLSSGFTHILFNASEFERTRGYPMFRLDRRGIGSLAGFWSGRLAPVYSNGTVAVYALVPEAGPKTSVPEALLSLETRP